LGHAWATQGSPNPNPKQAEGRGLFSFTQLPNYQITHLLNSAVRTWQVDPGSDFRVFKEFRATSHPWALSDYICFLRPNQLRIRTCPWLRSMVTISRAGAMGIRLSAGTGKLKLSPTKPVGSAQTNDRPSGNDIA
jgi:hypothetical protein